MDDREKITMLLERTPRLFVMYGEYAEAADFLINNDVATVVRCKNCVYYEPNPFHTEEMVCKYWSDWNYTEPNDYCSNGESSPRGLQEK